MEVAFFKRHHREYIVLCIFVGGLVMHANSFIYLYWIIILQVWLWEVPKNGNEFLSDECTISDHIFGEDISPHFQFWYFCYSYLIRDLPIYRECSAFSDKHPAGWYLFLSIFLNKEKELPSLIQSTVRLDIGRLNIM